MAKRQSAVQTPTFGAEFVILQKAVEEEVTIRYYLQAMGVKVSKPTVIYGDNLSAIINSTKPGIPLKKKYLALSYHFCREHCSAGVVDIQKIDTKYFFQMHLQRHWCRTSFTGTRTKFSGIDTGKNDRVSQV